MTDAEESRNTISGTVYGLVVQARDIHGDVFIGAPQQPVQWPCRIGVVPLRADCFQQRDLSATLADTVGAGGTAVLTQVLAGLGGVGKTQIAAEFAQDRWAAGELDLLAWITAGSREAIVSGYASAATKIGLAPSEEDDESAS